MRVVIDPGHGGPDPGARGPGGLTEKEVVLKVAQRVDLYLRRMRHETLLTRADDGEVSLSRRVEAANQAGADLFVSIHANAHADPRAQGLEVWHSRPVDARGQAAAALAYCLLRWLLVTTRRRDRGLKYADDPAREFAVLRATRMPAVLVELAFLSNPAEEHLLAQDWFLEKAALGIAFGLQSFITLP